MGKTFPCQSWACQHDTWTRLCECGWPRRDPGSLRRPAGPPGRPGAYVMSARPGYTYCLVRPPPPPPCRPCPAPSRWERLDRVSHTCLRGHSSCTMVQLIVATSGEITGLTAAQTRHLTCWHPVAHRLLPKTPPLGAFSLIPRMFPY